MIAVSDRTLQRIAAWLLALGLMLGPVYLYMTTRIVGGEAGPSVTLTERAQRWTLPDGSILRFARGSAYKPVEVQLDPQMNPIGLQLVFDGPPEGSAGTQGPDDYQATLMQADQPIVQRPVRVTLAPGGKQTIDAGTIEVYYPGAYIFVLEAPATPHVMPTQVTLNVRQHVQTPLMPLVWLGFAMIAVAAAFYLERWLRGMR